jgi:hypothetical protein
MSRILVITFLLALAGCAHREQNIYLFSNFTGNGEDGLHLAWSMDGVQFQSLFENRSILKPEAGQDKLMRDPFVIRGGDGKFHMVWTVSWNERGIGYAWSDDLLHWTDISGSIRFPEGTRHGTVLKITEKELDFLLTGKRKNSD